MLFALIGFTLAGCGNQPREEAAPRRTASAAAPVQPKPDTRPVIAAFGDSLSAGFGLDAGKSYPDDLQRLLDDAGYAYRTVNMGVNGDTTTDGVERLPSVLALNPKIVVLEFGGNDGLCGQPIAVSTQNMVRMVESLRQSGATIVVAGMTLPRNYGPDYIRAFEQMYVDLSRQYKLVRIPFLLEGVGGNPKLTQPDGLHPTAEGAEIVAHTVFRYLQPLLERRSTQ